MESERDVKIDVENMLDAEENKSANVKLRKKRKYDTPSGLSNKKDYTGKKEIQYGIEECPPWHLTILFAFQHYLLMFGATVSLPLLITPAMCIGNDGVGKSEVIGTVFFVSGLATLLQTTFGTRLPIIQGQSFSFIPPLFAIFALPKWKCPEDHAFANLTSNDAPTDMINTTVLDWRREVWTSRMREVQGALAVASVFQILVGVTGLLGFILRFIGPLSIAPTICLIGLQLYIPAANSCSKHWGIAFMTICLIVIFSQYLQKVQVPFPTYSKGKGCHKVKYPIFKLLPVFLSMVIAWVFCAILTYANVFPSDPAQVGYGARTDSNLKVLRDARWFRFPYPGQWGWPTLSTAAVLGMLAGVVVGMIESVGDYYACARLSEAPPPPIHAVNRGMLFEGIGIACAGVWGCTSGVTSYSENIGAISITKVASRRVIQISAIMMIFLGTLGKFGALFVTIPEPIIGGIFMVVFGIITAVGVSNLQFVDLNSSRNIFVFGFSVFLGHSLPDWIVKNPNAIQTGNATADQVIFVLLSTQMFVGGFVGLFLDNTIPGTPEERGLLTWRSYGKKEDAHDSKVKSPYDFPFGMSYLRKAGWPSFIPVCPTYQPILCKKTKKKQDDDVDEAKVPHTEGFDNPVMRTAL